MSIFLSPKCYQDNKETLQKKLVKDIKVFLEKIKEKSDSMVMNDIKIYQNMKNKNWLSMKKTRYDNYKKLFSFRKLGLFLWLGKIGR